MTRTQVEKAIAQLNAKQEKIEEKENTTDWDEEMLDLIQNAITELEAIGDHYDSKGD